MVDIPIVLIATSETPIYQQLCDALRQGIVEGTLKAGDTLPSTRDLARKLGISRHTVLKAVELLIGYGYVESVDKALVIVRSDDEAELDTDKVETAPLPERLLSRFAHKVLSEDNAVLPAQLQVNGTPHDQLPVEQWRKLVAKQLRDGAGLFDMHVEPFGHLPLRQAIASYLNRFRSLRCQARNVAIFAGPMAALDFVTRLTIDTGDVVAVENPGFPHARRMFAAHGAAVRAINVDSDGLMVERLSDLKTPVKLVYVTPAHHDPTGAVLSLARRQKLLEWADTTGATIIEDGFDSEYWYKTRPLPAIQGLDENGSVIYVSSFWRALFPITRMSFVVFPNRWMPAATRLKGMLEREISSIEQRAITEFVEDGYLERHFRRTHRLLSQRRQLLVMALISQFGGKVRLAKEGSGMHLLIELNLGLTQLQIVDAATAAGLPLICTTDYYLENPNQHEYMVPFSHLTDEEIANATAAFRQKLSELGV